MPRAAVFWLEECLSAGLLWCEYARKVFCTNIGLPGPTHSSGLKQRPMTAIISATQTPTQRAGDLVKRLSQARSGILL